MTSAPGNLGLGEDLPSVLCLLTDLAIEPLKKSLARRLSMLYRIA